MLSSLMILLIACFVQIGHGALPDRFLGTWVGVPEYSVLGPWGNVNFTFTINKISPTEFLMQDFFSDDFPLIPNSKQQFWVTEGKGLIYCGMLYDFFSTAAPTLIRVPFNQSLITPTTMQFCRPQLQNPNTDPCSARWTLNLTGPDTLVSELVLWNPVKHLKVTLTRDTTRGVPAVPNPLPPPCNLTGPPNYDLLLSKKQQTPFFVSKQQQSLSSSSSSLPTQKESISSSTTSSSPLTSSDFTSESYEHCYVLNPALDFKLQWTLSNASQTLVVVFSSAAGSSDWLAFGFNPTFPGMAPADIVLAYAPSGQTQPCVRAMHAAKYVGTPVDSSNFQIRSSQYSYEGGRAVVKFERPLVTGTSPIDANQPMAVIYARGSAPSSCTAPPEYHFGERGVRVVNWAQPASVFPDWMKC